MQERAPRPSKPVLDEALLPNDHHHSSSHSNRHHHSNNNHHKVAIKEEGEVAQEHQDRVYNHKEEEHGVQEEVHPQLVDHNEVAWLPSSILLDPSSRLQEELHHCSEVEVMSMVVLDPC